jgi:hypothetical protein
MQTSSSRPVAQYAISPPKMKLAIRSMPSGWRLKASAMASTQTMNWNSFSIGEA